MQIQIMLSEHDIKRLILRELSAKLGEVPLKENNVSIKVKSKQNYKAEWEEAAIKVEYIDTGVQS